MKNALQKTKKVQSRTVDSLAFNVSCQSSNKDLMFTVCKLEFVKKQTTEKDDICLFLLNDFYPTEEALKQN